MTPLLRRLRVQAHFTPSGWVVEIAALIALVAMAAEYAAQYPGAFR